MERRVWTEPFDARIVAEGVRLARNEVIGVRNGHGALVLVDCVTSLGGATVAIIMRRTDWFEVSAESGAKGWVHRSDMAHTLQGTGELLPMADPSLTDFTNHDWEFGLEVGDFGGANAISAMFGYSLNESLAAELHLSHILGDQTNQYIADIGLVHSIIMPDVRFLRRLTPFVGLGTGVLRLEPKARFAGQVFAQRRLAGHHVELERRLPALEPARIEAKQRPDAGFYGELLLSRAEREVIAVRDAR